MGNGFLAFIGVTIFLLGWLCIALAAHEHERSRAQNLQLQVKAQADAIKKLQTENARLQIKLGQYHLRDRARQDTPPSYGGTA